MYNFVTIDFEPAIRHTIATLISQYQKYLSPLKGYSCPHRLLYGNESCSQYVKQTILEQDLRTALYMSRQRFRQCSLAGQELVRLAAESNESSCNDCCSNSCLQCCDIVPSSCDIVPSNDFGQRIINFWRCLLF